MTPIENPEYGKSRVSMPDYLAAQEALNAQARQRMEAIPQRPEMTPIEKLKELVTALGDDHFDGISEDTRALNALIDLAPSFIALWEAADGKSFNGMDWVDSVEECKDRLNAKAAEVLK